MCPAIIKHRFVTNTDCHLAGCGIERTYVFRVRAHIGSNNAVCVRRSHQGSVYYVLTQRGMEILNNVVEYVPTLPLLDAGRYSSDK